MSEYYYCRGFEAGADHCTKVRGLEQCEYCEWTQAESLKQKVGPQLKHPMSEAWLDWQPIATLPRDGESYLVWDDRKMGGDPEVVYWEDEARCGGRHLNTLDGPTYHVEHFTHWARIPGPV